MYRHIVQTDKWAQVKNIYGTPAIEVDGIFYTKHKIPYTKYFYAYCPRVDPTKINFDALKKSLKENNCVGLTFDVPNVLKNSQEEKQAIEIFEKYCKKSKRSEFAKANFLMDLNKPESELFEGMQEKHRYNTRYALKHGVVVKLAENKDDFDKFFELFRQNALRQKYFIRSKKYYETIWETLHPQDICHILTAEYEGKALVSWMVFVYDEVLYYPYGGSILDHKNLFPSNAVGWEVIRLGKIKNCKIFDMWGAAENIEDKNDSYYGFTNFKAKFGGVHVVYMDSYDFEVNKLVYSIFTTLNKIRWYLLDFGISR